MTIDLRSDTVTRPSAAMRRVIAEAEVGDDLLDRDPTTRRLEERTAELLGTQRALFFPTGTMANQAAIWALSRPGSEMFVHEDSHIVNWEMAGIAALAGVQARMIRGAPRVTLDTFHAAVRDPSRDGPRATLLTRSRTRTRRGGGHRDAARQWGRRAGRPSRGSLSRAFLPRWRATLEPERSDGHSAARLDRARGPHDGLVFQGPRRAGGIGARRVRPSSSRRRGSASDSRAGPCGSRASSPRAHCTASNTTWSGWARIARTRAALPRSSARCATCVSCRRTWASRMHRPAGDHPGNTTVASARPPRRVGVKVAPCLDAVQDPGRDASRRNARSGRESRARRGERASFLNVASPFPPLKPWPPIRPHS